MRNNSCRFCWSRGAILIAIVCGALLPGHPSLAQTTEPAAADAGSARQSTLLDADWLFHRGDAPQQQVIDPPFDDKDWQHVDVPHDYILDGKYDSSLSRNHGYLPLEVAWYRKHFTIPASDEGKILRLDFDGVYRDSEVWLNGQRLGKHPSGFTPFSFDISKVAKLGGENVLVVHVDPRTAEGWWYEGGGIYRHVHLTALSPLHVAQYGTYIVSTVPNGEQGAADEAEITIQTTLENQGAGEPKCEVVSEIIGPDGQSMQTLNATDFGIADGPHDVVQKTKIEHPRLWSINSPQVYQLRTTIMQDGKPIDSTTTNFGIRTIHFDKDKGFFLNGQHVEIQGCACHQDFPGVGIGVPDSLETWRAEQLKKSGCNGWRTAHDMAIEAVIDACDHVGLMVMDENRHLGDTQAVKTPTGTGVADLSDLAAMICRDRNHPSVIMWSMCNEEDLQGEPEAAKIVTAMMAEVHKYDQTRPITSAMNGRGGVKIFLGHGIADVEDMIGVNYNYESLAKIHQRHPDKPMFGSEDCNDKTARGEYVQDTKTGMASAYNLSEKPWHSMIDNKWMAGAYVWTGFDYKGEPNPFGWPDVSNNTGIVDSCGFPKDKFYYFQSCWSDKPMIHILPDNWNWATKGGKPIRVIVFSNAKQIELFLNDKSYGTKQMPFDSHVEWQVPYQPGELVAKGYTDGKLVATESLQTTDAPAKIELTVDRTELHADAEDAVVAKVAVLDAKGRIVPDSSNRITFQVTGGGKILGVGNGNPADHDTDRSNQRNAFHGHCIAVIEAGKEVGSLQVTANSPGLEPGSVSLVVH